MAPDDPRAASADGTISIEIDHKNGQLSMSYLAHAKPITRHVPLPPDSASARTEAVALAGNLARDEASDLAAQLREQRPPVVPAVPSSVTKMDPAANGKAADDSERARLVAVLDDNLRSDRPARHALGWEFITGAALEIGVASYGLVELKYPSAVFAFVPAIPLLFQGAAFAFTNSPFQHLASDAHGDAGTASVENTWVKAADEERSERRRLAISAFGDSVFLGSMTAFLYLAGSTTNTPSRDAIATAFVSFGVVEALVGVYLVSVDGPVERSLKTYQLSSGRVPPPAESAIDHVHVALAPGGAMASFSTTF